MNRLILILTIFLCRCSDGRDNQLAEETAKNICNILDSNLVDTFYHWNYFTRGGDNWVRKYNDSDLYVCKYFQDDDSTTLMIYDLNDFTHDFPCSLKFNADLNPFQLTLQKNLININGNDSNGRDILLRTGLKIDSLFPVNNPYRYFESLQRLKNKLKIIGVTSYSDHGIGNFIRFYLSRQYVLHYVPDTSKIFNENWRREILNGKILKRHWYFVKLDGYIDNG
jgi:hypothetical protein